MRKRVLSLGALLLAGMATVAGARAESSLPLATEQARLGWLDKVTGQVSTLDIRVGRPVVQGTLTITLRTCRTRPPEDPPESAAFLEITERAPGQDAGVTAADTPVFTGWMFASSPAVSAMEHGVYDVWVLACTGGAHEAVDAPTGGAVAPLPDFLSPLGSPGAE